MKRNSLFTKLLAMMLCVMMVVGCLPLSALADANDWESEIDPADPIPGSEEDPIDLTADLVTEGDKTATVTVPAGETVYYKASRLAGMIMTINGGEGVMCTGDNWTPYVWTITNDGAEDAEYVINVDFPVGTVNNPQDLSAGASETVTLEAGSQGWYFDFVAYENGYVTFKISGENWQWQVTNNSTSVQDELYTSVVAEGEEVTDSLTYKYTAEEEYVIMVNTYDSEDTMNAPAGDVTVEVTFVSGWGTEESPYQLTELENYVTIGANETVYYYGYFSGMNMTVSGNENFVVNYNDVAYADSYGSIEPIAVVSDGPRMPIYLSVTNNNAEESGYYITFAYPEGSMENPETLWENSTSSHTFAEGDSAWYYGYTGYSDGYLTFTISADCGWQYVINNITAGTYGDTQWSDSDPVVTTQTFTYYAGEEYVMEVVTYNPDNQWVTPAGTINVEVTFVAGFGTEDSPYMLNEQENDVTIADGDPVYYQGYFSGMNMTVTGEGEFSVIYNGETIAAVDGVVSIPVNSENPRMPIVFAIDGSGDFSVDFTYPAGHMENPAVAVLGDNTASVAAGTQGYFWTYTAEKAGELNVTISGADNWAYVVNNMTTYVYGDTQWSDSDPVVNPTVITVAEGDVIQIMMNGYDPDAWEAPAATLTINLAYAGCAHANTTTTTVDATCDTAGSVTVTCSDCGEIISTEEIPALGHNYSGDKGACINCGEYQPASNLKYMATWALSFQDYIGMSNMVVNSGSYDRLFIVATQVDPNGTVTTETIEGERYGTTKYYSFVKQILAWSMSENVTLELFGEKGGVVYAGQSTVASVESLALDMLAKYDAEGNALNCQVLVDMLNYGAAVQTAYNHFADNLPNTQITEYADYATAETPSMTAVNTNEGSGTVKILNTGISMQDKVMLTVMVQMSQIEGYEVRCKVGDVTTTATEIVPIEGMAAYGIASFAVTASNMREVHTIAIYNSETDEVASAVYSLTVEAFANKNLGGQYNDVAVTLMKYGDSVYEYANKE